MSSSVNGDVASRPPTDPSSSSKSKKRKHEGKEGRVSSKKQRRHVEAQLQNAVEAASEQPVEVTSEKKKKKKSKKHPDVVAEEAVGNGRGADALENVEDPQAGEPSSPHDSDPETTSVTKTKKKKKHKTKDAAIESATVATNGTTTTVDADNDIDFPDAPPPETSATMLPSTSNTQIEDLLSSSAPSSFHSTRISLLLSIPAIAISQQHALSSILATHLSPLLLTYFPPAQGIVLAFSNPILSAEAAHALNEPLQPPPASAIKANSTSETGGNNLTPSAVDATGTATTPNTLALASDEFGACWAWLTITLLVFRPLPGDELTGWTNVTSEGFVGVVGYNYFQAAVGQKRIPKGWKWMGATGQTSQYGQQHQRKRGRKGRLGDGWHSSQNHEDEEDDTVTGGPVLGQRSGDEMGYFVDEKGDKVPEVLTFRVVDTEMVPAHEAGGLSLQIDATLLDKQAEEALILEEKEKFERQQGRGAENGEVTMSGALASSRQGSVVPSTALGA